MANFIFFYFDQTYAGFINNLGRYNPELGERKLALSKMNIYTIQYWIIRRFSGKDIKSYINGNFRNYYSFMEKDAKILSDIDNYIKYLLEESWNYGKLDFWALYHERLPYFNPRFKFSAFLGDEPAFISDQEYIPLDFVFTGSVIPPTALLVGPVYVKSFAEMSHTTPHNIIAETHCGSLL